MEVDLRYAAVAVLALVFVATAVLAQQDTRDVVHLKNGSIIKGRIVELVPAEQVRIETSDGSIFVFPMDEVLKIEAELNVAPAAPAQKRKDPFGAAVLSFFIPGLGQYYNGQVGKGLLQQALVIGGAAVAVGASSSSTYMNHTTTETNQGQLLLGLGLVLAVDVWSISDAHATAERINEEIDSQHSRGSGAVPELGLLIAGDSVGVELALRF